MKTYIEERAIEVANYIISYCATQGKPINNLKLQAMLYFIWVDFWKKTRRGLFSDDICAWRLGPVVPSVYYAYCAYGALPINLTYETIISEEDGSIIDEFCKELIDRSVCNLVNETHIEGTPWHRIYANGTGNRARIPFYMIKNFIW